MGQSYFESSYLCHHHNIRVPSQGETLTEKRRPSMTKKGIKSCSCWHMLNWAPNRAKIKWKAIEKALAAEVNISEQSIQKHVSWARKILLLVFWERSGKCTILLTTRPLYREEESFKLVLRGTRNLRHRKLDRCKHFCMLLQLLFKQTRRIMQPDAQKL